MMLDSQDLAELIGLVQVAWGQEFGSNMWRPVARPTTRMVNLKMLEIKLIKMKGGLDDAA